MEIPAKEWREKRNPSPRRIIRSLWFMLFTFWINSKQTTYLNRIRFLKEEKHKIIIEEYIQIGKMIGSMMNSPEKFSVSKLPTAPAN